MSGAVWNFASFIVALGILVTVHEFGHFWVARKCGVKVERFSIGFGKSLWKRVGDDGTEYSIALIPLGGYVKMLDGRVDTLKPGEQQFAFDKKSLWQRSAIVAAGPVFNFLFAIFAYWLVFMIGVPAVKPVIGEVIPHSIMAEAGIQPGVEFKSISGVDTPDWESVNMELISHIGDDSMTVTVSDPESFGVEQIVTLNLASWNFNPEQESAMESLGFKPYSPAIQTKLSNVVDGGAAADAGFIVDDQIVAIDDAQINDWGQVVDVIRSHPNKPLSVQVLRQGQTRQLTLTPTERSGSDGSAIGFAGISPQMDDWPDGYRFEMQYGVFESIGKSVDKTGQLISLTFSMLKKLAVGDVGLNNLSGPISIAKGAGATAGYGFIYFLGFLALISVNLGIINLVPLPMLDGGHLLFFAIEAITRRPVPEKLQEMGYRIGGAIIFSLMAIAIFNDFTRL